MSNLKKYLGLAALAASIIGTADMQPTFGGVSNRFSTRDLPLTPKQKKARAKNNRGRKARKINWK